MQRTAAILAGLAVFACGPETRFVAIEPEADIRVIAAVGTNNLRSIKALTADQPFSLALKELFETGDTLTVYVFRYELASLPQTFPGLVGLDPVAAAAALNPTFGEPGAGRYAAPTTVDGKILSAVISEDSDGEIQYSEVAFDQKLVGGGVVFQLPAAIACPPGQGTLRVFKRDDSGRVCVMQRTETCEWEDERACTYFEDLFGRAPGTVLQVREVPPNLLVLGSPEDTCTEGHDVLRGESRTFDCDGTQVSIQNTARGRGGVPWLPDVKTVPALQGPRVVLSRGAKGAVYAFERGTFLELRRLAPKDDDEVAESAILKLPMAGQPQNIFISNPGEVEAISTDASGDHIAVSASAVVAVLDRDFMRVPNDYNFFTEPITAPEMELPSARRRGPVIFGSGQTMYGLVDTGIAVLQPSGGTIRQTAITADGMIPPLTMADAPKIVAVRNRSNQERIVVWTQSGTLHMFNSSAQPVIAGCNLTEVLAAFDGPRVFRRPNAARPFALEIVDLQAIETTGTCDPQGETQLIPPNDEDVQNQRLEIDSLTYVNDGMRDTINYRYGNSGGVLDLGSGLSQAVSFDSTPATSVLFPAQGNNKNWALFAPANSQDMRGFLIPVFEGP